MYKPKDVITQLVEYIKKNLSKGYNIDSLKFSLLAQGYSRTTVDNAMLRANKELATTVPLVKEKPQITYRVLGEGNRPIRTLEIPYKRSFWIRLKDFFR